MLKSMGKIQKLFYDCNGLSQQIAVNKLTRTTQFHDFAQIIERIKLDQGVNI